SLPNASFLRRRGLISAKHVWRLHQPHVGDHRGISHDPYMRAADGDRGTFTESGFLSRSVGKVRAVKTEALNQMPASLRLNRRDVFGAQFHVTGPVAAKNR